MKIDRYPHTKTGWYAFARKLAKKIAMRQKMYPRCKDCFNLKRGCGGCAEIECQSRALDVLLTEKYSHEKCGRLAALISNAGRPLTKNEVWDLIRNDPTMQEHNGYYGANQAFLEVWESPRDYGLVKHGRRIAALNK